MAHSRSQDEERSDGRRPRSRSPSDSEEERRRHRRRREREDRSPSPRDRRREDKYETRDRRDNLRDDDRHRESSGSDRRHRDRDGGRHTSDRRTHDRRTHTEGDRHHESRHRRRRSRSPRRRHSRSPRRRSREGEPRAREEEPKKIEAYKKASGPLPDQQAAFRGGGGASGSSAMVPHQGEPEVEKQVPNFAPTGLLAAATNTIEKSDGTRVVLKYHEPPEARKPSAKDAWKIFVFKGQDIVDTIPLSERSCWLIGKELAVVDLPAEHPTISRQHAIIQFRYVEKKNEFGDRIGRVKPYLLDLESANGTFLNGERIEQSRFVEIRDKDLIKFGESTREYVIMLPPKE